MATSEPPTDTTVCPECNDPAQPEGGELICPACGLVVEERRVDYQSELCAPYDPDDEEITHHTKAANETHSDHGLGSQVGFHDSFGDGVLDRRRASINRSVRSGSKKDRGRGYVTCEIQRMGAALGLGESLVDQGKRLFTQVHDREDHGGRDLDVLAGATVYGTARIHQRALTPADVVTVARADARPIARRWTWMQETLGLAVPPPDPRQRVRVVARESDVSETAAQRALTALEGVPDAEVYNGSPSTLAAALLWLASDETQAAIADAAGVSAVGLRKRWERLPEVDL